MNNEKKLILEMLQQGKITPEEAQRLLDVQDESTHNKEPVAKSYNKKFLRVFVQEGDTTKVNINVPLVLAQVALKLIPQEQLKLDLKTINVDEILNLIQHGSQGELVNIETFDKGKEVKVRVFVG